MKLEGLEHYHTKEWMSPSALSNCARCPRRYFYSNGCRLAEKKTYPAMKFGEAIHAGLGCLFEGEGGGGRDTLPLDNAMHAFDRIWTREYQDENPDPKRNTNRALQIFRHFHANHTVNRSLYTPVSPSGIGTEVANRVSPFEIAFAVDVGCDLPLVGRIDMLGRHNHTGELWGIEFKTTSELSARFVSGFELSPQVLCYSLALQLASHQRIAGVIIEALLVAKVSVDSLILPVFVREHSFEDTISWIHWIRRRIKECEDSGDWPKDISACNPYSQFGQSGYTCDFQRLCLVDDWRSLKDTYVVLPEHRFLLTKDQGCEQ